MTSKKNAKHTPAPNPAINPVVEIALNGPKQLVIDFRAQLALEELGYDMLDPRTWLVAFRMKVEPAKDNEPAKVVAIKPSLRTIRDFVYAGLRRHHRDVTLDQVEDWLPASQDKYVVLIEALLRARALQADLEREPRPTKAAPATNGPAASASE